MEFKVTPKRDKNERRRSQRMLIPIKVEFTPQGNEKFIEEIFCQDISGGGVKLRLSKPLKSGEKFQTHIYFPGDPDPISAFSRVVWCREINVKNKGTCYEVGLQHLKISPKDSQRFVFLFCEMMLNYFIFAK